MTAISWESIKSINTSLLLRLPRFYSNRIFLYGVCVLLTISTMLLVHIRYNPDTLDNNRQCVTNDVQKKSPPAPDDSRQSSPWNGCPKPGDGRRSIIIVSMSGSYAGDRIGNQIWEYLSTWSTAKRYGLWPAMMSETFAGLYPVFHGLKLPVFEEMVQRCNLSQLLKMYRDAKIVGNANDLREMIENQGPGLTLIKQRKWECNSEMCAPYWPELRMEMQLQPRFTAEAHLTLAGIREELQRKWISMNVSLDDVRQKQEKLEFVGVHARLTDYTQHLGRMYRGAVPFNAGFFRHAMDWMRKQIKNPVVFVVSSDDIAWCKKELTGDDVVIAGNGVSTSVGHDLALLGSCNHSIFTYGTFGLTTAMLANGKYTVLYDTQQNTHSKEGEFAQFLPGWRILNNDGQILKNINFLPTHYLLT